MKSIAIVVAAILCVVAIAMSGTRPIQLAFGATSISLVGAEERPLGKAPAVPMCEGQTINKHHLTPNCDAVGGGAGGDGGGGMVAGTVVDAIAAGVTGAAAAAGAVVGAELSSLAGAAVAGGLTGAAAVGLDAALHELNSYSQYSELPRVPDDVMFDTR